MQCMLDGGWGTGWGGGEKHQENCFMAFNYCKKNLNCMRSNCITYLNL